jgi:hypothetical protein
MDYVLVGMSALGLSAIASLDGSVTVAQLTSPSATKLFSQEVLAYNSSASAMAATQTLSVPKKIPIISGTTLTITGSAAGSVFLYLEEPT